MKARQRSRTMLRTWLAAWVCLGAASVLAADGVTVIRAAKIYVGDGSVVEGGAVVVRDGSIVAVGADVSVPSGAVVIDLKGGSITPGLIDANAWVEATDRLVTPLPSAAAVLRELFHDPNHNHAGTVGCCGSMCPRSYMHADGAKCSSCGFPDVPPVLAAGTRPSAVSAEQSSEVIPHTCVIDSVNLRSPDFGRLAAGGVTTVFVAPDSAAVIGSRGAVVQTAGATSDRVIREAGAVKASMGTDPSWRGMSNNMPFRQFVSFNTRRPTTRMGVTWVFRKAFHDAQRWKKGEPRGGADTACDSALKVIDGVRRGEIPLRIQARMQHDIMAALRLTEEFGLSFVLEEATEAYRCLDEIVARHVPVIFGPIYVSAPGHRAHAAETHRNRLHTFLALLNAGVETALTAQELRDEDGLARQAMYAMRNGATLEQVLPTVTQMPAKLLGLDNRLGTVAAKKQADLVLWSGEPFGATSKPVVVMIRGEVVVDRRKG